MAYHRFYSVLIKNYIVFTVNIGSYQKLLVFFKKSIINFLILFILKLKCIYVLLLSELHFDIQFFCSYSGVAKRMCRLRKASTTKKTYF